MFENSKKGWHGAYSISGKITAEHFDEILRKEEIINRQDKKFIIKDFFEPDKEITNIDYLKDTIKSFQIYERQDKNFRNILSNLKPEKKINHKKNYNAIKSLMHKEIYIKENQYEPNYDLVFSKIKTGIKWNKLKGRKNPPSILINSSNYDKNKNNFFLSEKGKKYNVGNTKCLVNMDKYTKRGEFIDLKNIRIRYDKAYNKKLIKSEENQESDKNSSNQINSIPNDFNISSFKNLFKNKIKNKSKSNRENIKQSLSQNIKAPDFKKNLPRKYFQKTKKNNYLSALTLNYDLIHEKFSSDIKFNHKKNHNKIKKFIGIDSSSLTDCYKYLDKLNNHTKSNAPNMKLTTSRAYYENINKKKFFNSALSFSSSKSTFYKNSFNNFINLKMINSPIFKKRKKNRSIINCINKIKNDMIFNDKSYKQLMQENDLNNLDGITFQSYKNKKKDNFYK